MRCVTYDVIAFENLTKTIKTGFHYQRSRSCNQTRRTLRFSEIKQRSDSAYDSVVYRIK